MWLENREKVCYNAFQQDPLAMQFSNELATRTHIVGVAEGLLALERLKLGVDCMNHIAAYPYVAEGLLALERLKLVARHGSQPVRVPCCRRASRA